MSEPSTHATPSPSCPDPASIPAEPVACPGCGADDWERHACFQDLDFHVPGRWQLARCRQCALIYLNPRPKEEAFHLIYPPNYVPYQMELRPDTRWLMRTAIVTAYEGAKLKEIDKVSLPRNPRILDVGCGAGFFLTLLKKRGWHPVGVEPNEDLVKRANEQLGLDVRAGTLSSAPLEPASFDLITLWHVLEHDPTPRETLRECYRLLKPGGAVIAQVPDYSSWEARRLGNYFWSNDIPRHMIFFTRKTVAELGEREHFRVEKLMRTKNATSWVWTLLRWLKWDWYAEMEKNIGKITLLYLLILPFHAIFSRGDWVTAVFRKPAE